MSRAIIVITFLICLSVSLPQCVIPALAVYPPSGGYSYNHSKVVKVCAVYDFVNRKCKKWKIIKQ